MPERQYYSEKNKDGCTREQGGEEDPDRASISTPIDAEQRVQRRRRRSHRNRWWDEDEEMRLAVLLVRYGPSWNRVAEGLRGRTANIVRCKVYNDIRVAQTTYRNKRKEYGRLLFRVAYRMEERDMRLEQLGPEDFLAELSPVDHPQIHAAYYKAVAPAREASQSAQKEGTGIDRSTSPLLWWHDCGGYRSLPWDTTGIQSNPAEQNYYEDAYNPMYFTGYWEDNQQLEPSDTYSWP